MWGTRGCGVEALLCGEVGAGALKGLDEERGPFEVDAVAGEAGCDLGEAVLDLGAGVEAG
jgi:hypothetical protein